MAVASPLLTYEDYVCGPEEMRRYDILDGVKVYMPNPTIRHQTIVSNVHEAMKRFYRRTGAGLAILAPCDVLIRRNPLRTRQPDVLFISTAQFGSRSLDDPSPLDPAPELVVEILSPSDTIRVLDDKLVDYAAVGVNECWVVRRTELTVELLRLTQDGAQSAGVYKEGETVQSLTFPGLTLDVSEIFVP